MIINKFMLYILFGFSLSL